MGEAGSLLQLGRLLIHYPALWAEGNGQEVHASLSCLQQALNLAEAIEAQELCSEIHLSLSELYEQQGDAQRALFHYQAYHQAARIIFDEELSEKTKKLQILHQVERSKQEATLQRTQAELFRLRNVELATTLAEAKKQRRRAEEANRF